MLTFGGRLRAERCFVLSTEGNDTEMSVASSQDRRGFGRIVGREARGAGEYLLLH